jgi:hypothetical protein
MPEIDGLEFARRFRATHPSTPVQLKPTIGVCHIAWPEVSRDSTKLEFKSWPGVV